MSSNHTMENDGEVLENTEESGAAGQEPAPEDTAAPEAVEPESAPEDNKKEEADPLASLQKKYDELNERYLRMLAEYDNFRKRTQREKDAVYPAAVAGTVEKFLPVVDSFERALACECADAEFKKGVDLIFTALQKSLGDLSVEAIGAVGEPFDANLHNAVMHVEDENAGKSVVVDVLQKGYRIGDRVLRYAMVSVAN